jgi:uncharacterized protein
MATRKTARKPFHLMAKPTGFHCNIACDYCFYLQKESGTLKTAEKQRHMDDATLEAYVRGYIEANPAKTIEFAWQGGEPTLAGIGFYEKALRLQEKYGRSKIITNAIQTNGLLIDEEWAGFLSRNNFLVGISIDGPSHLHDAHRVSRNGKGVHAQVIKALGHLKQHQVEYNVLSVVNATTAQHPVEIYRYLAHELGARFIQFIPAVEQRSRNSSSSELAHPQTLDPAVEVTPWSVSGEDYGRFMIGVFDEWVRRDVGRVYVQLFDNALAAWSGELPSLCIMRPTCGSVLVIEQNGDVYSCDHYVYETHKLGNVRWDNLATLVDSKKQRAFGMAKADLPKACVQCEWRFVCHGGCPKHRIHRSGNQWHNHLCPGYKAIFSHMAPYMRFMASELRQHRSPAAVMRAAPGIAATTQSGHVEA